VSDEELIWEEPPPTMHEQGTAEWDRIANALREHPGVWAMVKISSNHANATHIKKGNLRSFQPAGSFEAKSRSIDSTTNNVKLYARYVGEQS